jgi:threonine/homoserine/homoserine lactone efflux protein
MPSTAHLVAFIAAAALIVAIPGPSLLFTIGRALSVGRRDALLTVVGNGLGLGLQVVGIAWGLGAVIAASSAAYTALKVVGAGYLVYLGVQAIRHRRGVLDQLGLGRPAAPRAAWRVLGTGIVVGVTNPKTVVFLGALLPQFVDRPSGGAPAQMLLLGAIFVALAVMGDGAVALAASRARDWFVGSPHRLARLGGAGGVMMIGLGAGLALSGRPD